MRAFIAIVFLLSSIATAQVGISPLVTIAGKRHASDTVTVKNDSLVPVAVALDARTLGVTADGKVAVLPLSKDVIVNLHETSARIEPMSSRTFDYEVKCDRCVTLIVATVTPIKHKTKGDDDGEVHAGVQINYAFATTVYVCDKAKGCRDSFKEIWNRE